MEVKDAKATLNGEEKQLRSHEFERQSRVICLARKCASLINTVVKAFVAITNGAFAVFSTFVWIIFRPFQVTADLVKFLIQSVEFVYKVIVNYRSIILAIYQWFENIFQRFIAEQIYRLNKLMKHKRNLALEAIGHRFAEGKIYVRGAFKISQKIFSHIASRTPGGKLTVTVLFVALAIWATVKLITCARSVTSVLSIIIDVFVFLIQPAVSTCNEIVNIALKLSHLLLKLIEFVLATLGYIVYVVYVFLLGVLNWHWKGLLRLSQLEVVQYSWRFIEYTAEKSFQVILSTVLPFLLEASLIISTVLMDGTPKAVHIAQVLFDKLFAVVIEESNVKTLLSPFTITVWTLIVAALVYAYRTRHRFPNITCLEIEENVDETASSKEKPLAKTKTCRKDLKVKSNYETSYLNARRYSCPDRNINSSKLKEEAEPVSYETNKKITKEDTNKGQHIHSDALKHKICTEFILDKCNNVGAECDHHHCRRPYHWQYNMGLGQWSDFGSPINETLEQLYCDVANDLFVTNEIEATSLNLPLRRHRQVPRAIKVDFEEMKLRVDYERIEMRRLSTESYTRCPDCSLATIWVWYWLDEKGTWQEYGDKETGVDGPKQEEIEAAYLRHDTSYDFKTTEYSFRIYFAMKPMYQRNMDPLRYTRRQVRRRPKLRTEQEIRALQEKARPQSMLKRWFSFGKTRA